jgi:hypothetical protein
VPFSKDSKLLQDVDNEEHRTAKRVDLPLRASGEPVDSQTHRQLVEPST